ncbi:MFS multidrug transporter [Paraphaeosphaeria sporulosa]
MPGRNRQQRPPRGGAQISSSSSSSSNNNANTNRTRQPRAPRQTFGAENRPVPAYSAISPGTAVSLVLKIDQPTGRQVTGIVADLLTRGDHPRGVKVRLRDGRVGRVQKIVSESDGLAGEEVAGGIGANLGRDGENGIRGRGGGASGFRHERDIREDDEYLYDEGRAKGRDLGLFAQLEEEDRRYQESVGRETAGGGRGEIATCPVCGEFEGDERAVAFHVEGHFTEG